MFAFGSYFIVIIYVMGTILAFVEIDEKVEKKFFEDILNEHNRYRSIHCSQHLKLDDFCSYKANTILIEMLSSDFSTESLEDYGVNKYLTDYIGVSDLNTELAKNIVKFWYKKGENYKYLENPPNSDADPFTQILWNDSLQLGLRMAITESGTLYVAATYFPKGNIRGQYKDNVQNFKSSANKN